MTLDDIAQVERVMKKQRTERPIGFHWNCGFVGTYIEWNNFLNKHKKDIQWRAKTSVHFKNGQRWSWFPEDSWYVFKNRGNKCQRMIVPRRIDYDFFWFDLYPAAMAYCTDIEWYGEPDKVNTIKENKNIDESKID